MAPAILARIVAASFFGVESIGLRAGEVAGDGEPKAAEERGTKRYSGEPDLAPRKIDGWSARE